MPESSTGLRVLSDLALPPCCAPTTRGQDSSQLPHASPRETFGRRPWGTRCTCTSWYQHESVDEPSGWSGQQRPCCSENRYRAFHLWEEEGRSGVRPPPGQVHRWWPKVKCHHWPISNLPLSSKCPPQLKHSRPEPSGQSDCHSGQDHSIRGASEAKAV